jgi:hypothetical protein
MHQFLQRKEMSIPGSGERKLVVVLTSPAVFVSFALPLGFSFSSVSVSSCGLPLRFNLLYFPLCYLLSSSSIPYVLPLSVFFPLLHYTLSLFSPPVFGSSSGFYSQRMQAFFVTAGMHHGGEGC